MTSVTVFAPASVSNVACGFDVLGFALSEPGDTVTARTSEVGGVRIASIAGDGGRLPLDPERNTAGRAAASVLARAGSAGGIVLDIVKGMPLASGIGSSAASAVAAVIATNEALGSPLDRMTLLACAMDGERAGAGAAHPDNVAPSMLGGFVLARGGQLPDVVSLPVPDGLAYAVLHPHMEVETGTARQLLGDSVPLAVAIAQWGNLGAFVASLYTSDFPLMTRCLVDLVAEPKRAALVPGFAAVQQAALDAGALGCSLSGAGPSIFALCFGTSVAVRTGDRMRDALRRAGGLDGDLYVGTIAPVGARVVQTA